MCHDAAHLEIPVAVTTDPHRRGAPRRSVGCRSPGWRLESLSEAPTPLIQSRCLQARAVDPQSRSLRFGSELPGGCPRGACVQQAASSNKHLLMLQAGSLVGPGRRRDGHRARQVPLLACARMQGLPAIVWHIVVHQLVTAPFRHQADPTMPCSSPDWAITRDQQSTQQAGLLGQTE